MKVGEWWTPMCAQGMIILNFEMHMQNILWNPFPSVGGDFVCFRVQSLKLQGGLAQAELTLLFFQLQVLPECGKCFMLADFTVLVFYMQPSHQGANVLLAAVCQDGIDFVGLWVLSALQVFIAVTFWVKSINAPSSAHVSADLGLHSGESKVTGNKVNTREYFYFFPVLSFIPAVLTSLVNPVWTLSTKATLWSELLNICEKQVADLLGFLVQTFGQRGNNWVHVCNN